MAVLHCHFIKWKVLSGALQTNETKLFWVWSVRTDTPDKPWYPWQALTPLLKNMKLANSSRVIKKKPKMITNGLNRLVLTTQKHWSRVGNLRGGGGEGEGVVTDALLWRVTKLRSKENRLTFVKQNTVGDFISKLQINLIESRKSKGGEGGVSMPFCEEIKAEQTNLH